MSPVTASTDNVHILYDDDFLSSAGFDFPFWIWIPLRLYLGLIKRRKPIILGQQLSGEIESLGKKVKLFKIAYQYYAVNTVLV